MKACGLCSHSPPCGSASATQGDQTVYLCHEDDHSCYERWTVWGERPYSYAVITAGAGLGGKGVLVTQNWREAADDIRSKMEVGIDVMVRRVDPGVNVKPRRNVG